MQALDDRNEKLYAQVIVDVSHARLDRIFEYQVPETLRNCVNVGHRVMVPFGQGNRQTEGFVLGLSSLCSYDPDKIKAVLRPLDEVNVLLPEQIELARWMAETYNCLLVEALRLMIPAQLRGNRVQEKKIQTVNLCLSPEGLADAFDSLRSKEGKIKAPKQYEILSLLQGGGMDVIQLEERLPGVRTALRSMEKKGWLVLEDRENLRKPYGQMKTEICLPPVMTGEQQRAIDRLNAAADAGEGCFVLKGVTGSGKTEVYLHAIKHCIDTGKNAIMLVPEISLTPQTVDRFRSRFGDGVAVLHSRLSPGERFDEWRRIHSGRVRVVVGARSAVFAPFSKLGLVVIDEEHESSYRSDKSPRYHVAEVARWRCRYNGGVLLLGSATPGLETWHAAQQGEFSILNLDQRINGKPLPRVEIVDMREELAQGNRSMFSGTLYQRMKECYLSEKQMILFLNRRGYSTFVNCRACGAVLTCQNCDVSMTYHKSDSSVHCHYCDAQKPIPKVCPQCGEAALKHFGVGTEQVEEQVKKLFPGIRVTRMDYDTTRKKDAHLTLLTEFSERCSDVLIGTQMIAKGLDFPGVTLVGVVAADASLHVPDFRSAERTFQLLTQVAGRAGRDRDAGLVVVQTYSPEHPSIRYSAQHDYDSFYCYEIESRAQSEFPPFADFVRFLFSGEIEGQVSEQCEGFRIKLESHLQKVIREKGLDPATLLYISAHASPLHYLRGVYRYQVVVKLKRNEDSNILMAAMSSFARMALQEGDWNRMEINPQNMS